MAIVSEAMQRIQFNEFLENTEYEKYQALFTQLKELEEFCVIKNPSCARMKVKEAHHLLHDFNKDFMMFLQKGEEKSNVFRYWNTFLYELVPILRDIIRADREGN